MMESVNCPICGRTITGETPGEMGKNLGDHMRDEHGDSRKN